MKRWVAGLAALSPLARSHQPVSSTATRMILAASTDAVSRLAVPIAQGFALPLGVVRGLHVRGGGEENKDSPAYEKLSDPAPGSPFHLAFPVHDLAEAKEFYGNVLGCKEGRSSEKWQDFSLHGHQIVCHWVGNDYRCQDYYNPVDGDEVPVPHFGLALTVDQFNEMAEHLRKAGVEFIVEPHLRFQGMPGEQVSHFTNDDQHIIASLSHTLLATPFLCTVHYVLQGSS
jgi:extradiol dioxygenase family protein